MQGLMEKGLCRLVLLVCQTLLNTKDPERKQRYLNRHKKNENWNDHNTASFYATNILWNKPTLTESIKDTNKRFKNINIKLK